MSQRLKSLFTIKNLIFISVIALAFYFMYRCPFEYVLGICCPGCGMTRAFISLLHCDIANAFHYHPLFPLVILMAVYAVLNRLHIVTIKSSTTNILLYIICAIFFVVYFIRLLGDSPIVYIDFKNSLAGQIIKHIKGLLLNP